MLQTPAFSFYLDNIEVKEIGTGRTLGEKRYELFNHLSNVLTVISDKKIEVGSGGTTDHYMPDIISAQDYYAFGAPLDNHGFSPATDKYRYGYNGKENDADINDNGEGAQDYGMRIYNPSLGKFLSVDPLTKKYPSISPYPFAMNRPIEGIDVDGAEFLEKKNAYIQFSYSYGGVALLVENFSERQKKVWNEIFLDGRNWDKNIGTSPLLSEISMYIPNSNNNDDEHAPHIDDVPTTFVDPQTNVLPNPQQSTYKYNDRKRHDASNLPTYRNSGAKTASGIVNGVSILTAAIDLYQYYQSTSDNIAWGDVIQGSYEQNKFAIKTMAIVQDAFNKGYIKPSLQDEKSIYAIMNYILEGDSHGNKDAEDIGKILLYLYNVPVQPAKKAAPPTVPEPGSDLQSTPSYGSVPK